MKKIVLTNIIKTIAVHSVLSVASFFFAIFLLPPSMWSILLLTFAVVPLMYILSGWLFLRRTGSIKYNIFSTFALAAIIIFVAFMGFMFSILLLYVANLPFFYVAIMPPTLLLSPFLPSAFLYIGLIIPKKFTRKEQQK